MKLMYCFRKVDSFVGRKNFTIMRSQILQVIITILIDVKNDWTTDTTGWARVGKQLGG